MKMELAKIPSEDRMVAEQSAVVITDILNVIEFEKRYKAPGTKP